MKNSALNKDIIKEFFKSRSRVLSIIAMVALGALAVIGLTVTGPTMRETIEKRLVDYNISDLVVQSTYGLDYEDRAAIDRTKGLKKVEYGYQQDIVIKGTDNLIRLESIGETMPKYKVVEGRLPEKIGELAIDAHLPDESIKVGQTIGVLKGNTDPIKDELKTDVFKIVGKVESPEYINVNIKGRSSYGKGQLDGFAIAIEDNFDLEVFTIARILLDETSNLYKYTSEYNSISEKYKNDLTSNLEDRPEKRLAKIKDDAEKEIKDAQEKIDDAKTEISDAEKKLKDARAELDDALVKYYDGKEEYERETTKAKNDIDKARVELADAKKKLDDGRKEYNDGVEKFNKEIGDAEKKIEDAKKELADAKIKLDYGYEEYEKGLSEYNDEISKAETKLNDAKKELDDARKKLDDGWKEYNDGVEEFEREIAKAENDIIDAENQLDDARKKLDDGYRRIESEEQKLKAGWDEYNSGLAELEAQRPALEAAKAQLDAAQAQIDMGYQELNSNEQALIVQKNQLEQAKAGIEQQIQQQQAIIDNPESTPEEVAAAQAALIALQAQLAEINGGLAQVETGLAQIAAQRAILDQSQAELNRKREEFNVGYQQFLAAEQQLISAKAKLEAGEIEIAKAKDELNVGEFEYSQGLKKLEDGKNTLASEKINGKQKLNDALNELDDGEVKYSDGKAEYDKGLEEFNEEKAKGEKKLADAKIELDDGQKEYDDGLKELQEAEEKLASEKSKGEKELKDALDELNDGEKKYTDGLKELEDGIAEYNSEVAKGRTELEDAYNKILDGEEEYKDGLKEFKDKTKDADAKISDGETEIADARKDLAKLKLPKYFVTGINDNVGIYTYIGNSRRMDMLALIFPIFFYAIAMLVTVTTMSRMVEEQRTQIGTLKSLGYSTGSIQKKFLIYGALPATLGAIIGIVFGHTLLAEMIFKAYSTGFVVGEMQLKPYPQFVILAFTVSVSLIVLTSLFTTNRTLKHNAAQLLRPKTPKSGTRIFLERIKPIWNRLSFLYKVTARNIFRYKARMTMTIIGVAGCTALLFMGFGIKDSITQIKPLQYNEIIHYNLAPIIDDEADKADIDKVNEILKTDDNIDKHTDVRYESGLVELTGRPDQEVSIITVFDDIAFKEFVSLRNRKDGKPISLSSSEIVLTEKLAKLLKLKVGDDFSLEDKDNDIRKLKVGAITENYVNHGIYLTPKAYKEIFGKDSEMNAKLLIMNNKNSTNEKVITELVSKLMSQKAVLSIVDMTRVNYQIGELLNSLNLIVLVLIAISSTLAIVVLYNLTNINVSERIRELSTIKVLGFYSMEVTSYVYRETFFLTIIGIIGGYLVGHILHWFIINALVPENIMMSPRVLLSNYLVSALITLVLSIIVMFLMHRKLRKVDMVEALKAIE